MLTPLPIDPDVTKMVARAQDGSPLTFQAALRAAGSPKSTEPVMRHARKIAQLMATIAVHRAFETSGLFDCVKCTRRLKTVPEQTSLVCTPCVREYVGSLVTGAAHDVSVAVGR